jgi:hypothetical protein
MPSLLLCITDQTAHALRCFMIILAWFAAR